MVVALAATLVAAVTVAVAVGPLAIPAGTVWRIIAHHVTGLPREVSWTDMQDTVVWQLRLPRALLAALVGAGLAVVGVATQALVRNPLADPYLLGISSGAATGAVLVIITGLSVFGAPSAAAAAFAGALLTFMVVYWLGSRGGSMAPLRLVLTGVAVGYALYGIAHYLLTQADNPGQTNSVLFWLLGSLGKAQWAQLGLPAAVLAAGVLLLAGQARAMNALLVGDETAASLGIDVERVRRILFALTSLVTGVMVSLTGAIGFVGLVVPHAVRLLVGSDHRRVLPVAVFGGGAFVVLIDVVARLALAPAELPIGVVTAVVGAPVFLWLLNRRGGLGGVEL